MKTLKFILALAVILIAGCNEEGPIVEKKVVQFKLGIANDPQVSATDFPDNFIVDLKLKSADGESQLENVIFLKSGADYVSQAVALQAGDYEVKEFIIDDKSSRGMQGLTDSFRVDPNISSVSIGNVAVKKGNDLSLLVRVYVDENGKKKLTDATASIAPAFEGGPIIKSYQLLARTNHITIPVETGGYFLEFVVEKEGYFRSTTYLQYSELETNRLEITLVDSTPEPGPAIIIDPGTTCFNMRLQFMDTGSVVLDWRNGDPKETLAFAVDPGNEEGTAFFERQMCYITYVPPARITGDVHLLKGLYFDDAADILDIRFATGLQILSLEGSYLDSLDLSANIQLNSLSLTHTYQIDVLTLPQQHYISNLRIVVYESSPFPTEGQLDYIIDNICTNAIARNILSGSITLSGVTLSVQSAKKISELANNYGWSVSY